MVDTAIDELSFVVPRPREPVEAGDITNLPAIEKHLGISLPEDYVSFGLVYGTGKFVSDHWMLEVSNPFSPTFFRSFREDCEFFQEMKDMIEGEVPYEIFPVVPGILPWGHDDNGYNFCWLTDGKPHEWPILITRTRDVYFEKINLPMTSLLASCFSGKMSCLALKPPFGEVKFVPKQASGK